MKKRLLLAGLLFGTFLTANAQQVTSFETSEGFTAGNIDGQKAWFTTGTDAGNITNQVIETGMSTDGTMSLVLNNEPELGGQLVPGTQNSNPIIGAFKLVSESASNNFNYSFDIYIGQQSINDSDFAAILYSSDQEVGLASRLQFTFEGDITIVTSDPGTGNLVFQDTEVDWAPETWYNVEVDINNTANTVTYSIDGVEIATGTTIGPDVIAMAFLSDNFGGFARIDNIVTPEGALKAKSFTSTEFSVYPNPVSDVVNVNSADALVNNVSIVDLNGRTVKTAKFDGVANAQINISDLSAGVYMMNVTSDKGSVTKKIVKN